MKYSNKTVFTIQKIREKNLSQENDYPFLFYYFKMNLYNLVNTY